MNAPINDYLAELLAGREPPCLSLYQPTHRHHPDNQQDATRFRNLLKSIERSLLQERSVRDAAVLVQPFGELADDARFWNHMLDGLAVFGGVGFFRVHKLQRPVPELAVVAKSFHIKPLARILQSTDRYQVLGLTLREVKLFEGNRDALDEVELAPGVPRTITEALGDQLTDAHQTFVAYRTGAGPGKATHHGQGSRRDEADADSERFFRAVDRAILQHHSRPSGLPLMLAALPEHHALFRRVSHNPFLMAQALDIHPDALPADALRERAWQLAQPAYVARVAAVGERFQEAQSKQRGTGDLAEAATAAASGRVETLLVEADRLIPGRLDKASGRIERDALSHPRVDDLLDDLAELVLERGGQLFVVPNDRMPTDTGVAAIYRF